MRVNKENKHSNKMAIFQNLQEKWKELGNIGLLRGWGDSWWLGQPCMYIMLPHHTFQNLSMRKVKTEIEILVYLCPPWLKYFSSTCFLSKDYIYLPQELFYTTRLYDKRFNLRASFSRWKASLYSSVACVNLWHEVPIKHIKLLVFIIIS